MSRRKLWAKEFDVANKEEYERITEELTRHCVNGPRDMIDLCNLAGYHSGSKKITEEAIKDILPDYSEQKLFSISADFGSRYPDLPQFPTEAWDRPGAWMLEVAEASHYGLPLVSKIDAMCSRGHHVQANYDRMRRLARRSRDGVIYVTSG